MLGQKLIENELDFDFRAETHRINTLEEFDSILLKPYESGERIFYRGESRNSLTRPLLPTLYRNRELLFDSSKRVSLVDADAIYDGYRRNTEFFSLYERIIGKVQREEMYSFLAFSQHYFGISPLIDFSKSLYVSLSFALKDRVLFDEDILLYTLEIKGEEDYTDSIEVANEWIKDYSVLLFRDIDKVITKNAFENPLDIISDGRDIIVRFKGQNLLELNAPKARLIDVPTNDLIRFQQGVFLLLDDFSLVGKSYLTKKIRDEFNIKKWIISKDICPDLVDMIMVREPYYQYKYITNINAAADAIKNKEI